MTTSPSEFTISEELKKWLGREMQLGTALIEAGAIKNFADAFKDPNPIYRDREYAKGTPYGDIIAPPTFFHCLREVGYARFPIEPIPWKNVARLNGGNEFEFSQPVHPGDVITGKAKLIELHGRQSKSVGPMIISVAESTYTNQKGDVVGKQRSTGIMYEAKG
jgi:acyl dehydratase